MFLCLPLTPTCRSETSLMYLKRVAYPYITPQIIEPSCDLLGHVLTMPPPYSSGHNDMTHIIRPPLRTSRLKIVLFLLVTTTLIIASLPHCQVYLTTPPRVITRSLPEERDTSGFSAAERLMLDGVLSGACDDWQPPIGNQTERGVGKTRGTHN